jgi:hypothetical protein
MLNQLALTTGLVMLVVVSQVPPQQPAQPADDRIEQLTVRVERLEKILFATSKLAVFDAERNLADAQQRLRDSERLFLQGFLTDAQLAADRFAVARARREVELARADRDGYRIASEIDLMQAEYALQVAEQQLEFTQRMANRGFNSLTDVADRRAGVDRAKKQLELARQRLDAAHKE